MLSHGCSAVIGHLFVRSFIRGGLQQTIDFSVSKFGTTQSHIIDPKKKRTLMIAIVLKTRSSPNKPGCPWLITYALRLDLKSGY